MSRDGRCGKAAELAERLAEWLASSPGRELVVRESRCVEQLLADLFGYYLLQVGWTWEFARPVANSRIRHHLAMEGSLAARRGAGNLVADARSLPVATDSIDAVFLPHTLDFAADPHQVLREAERVLIPEGRVIILGFNPWSSWGLWRIFLRRRGHVPWCGRFFGPRRVADWLTLLGFDIEVQRPLVFLPPLRRTALLRRLEGLESVGERWLGLGSAVYAIRAVKRVSVLTPLEPAWKTRSRVLPGQAVEPTARGGAGA